MLTYILTLQRLKRQFFTLLLLLTEWPLESKTHRQVQPGPDALLGLPYISRSSTQGILLLAYTRHLKIGNSLYTTYMYLFFYHYIQTEGTHYMSHFLIHTTKFALGLAGPTLWPHTLTHYPGLDWAWPRPVHKLTVLCPTTPISSLWCTLHF